MKKDRLVQDVQHELSQLRRVAELTRELTAVSQSDPQPWHSAAAAKFVADLTLGLENLLKRRAAWLGRELPSGDDSHSQMLQQFLDDPELGGKLSADLAMRLKKYLRFRHRFFHGYGLEVRWEIVEEPLRLMPETVEILADIWTAWLRSLPDDA